jgi:DNA-binding response OmpR family regulator
MTDKKINKGEKPLILIVDDLPKNLQVLGIILREKDYEIAAAAGGRQALDMVAARLPDLVLLDVIMPEPDGFQVCEKLKASAETKDIPVIFLTARTETTDIVKGFQLGAVDYVTKPFNKAELLARVSAHLELKKAQRKIIKLEQKNAALAMAVTANHEINQPLTVLQGNFDLFQNTLDQAGLTDKQQKFLMKMQEAMEKVQTILNKFKDSASIHFEDYLGDQKMVVFEKAGKPGTETGDGA